MGLFSRFFVQALQQERYAACGTGEPRQTVPIELPPPHFRHPKSPLVTGY